MRPILQHARVQVRLHDRHGHRYLHDRDSGTATACWPIASEWHDHPWHHCSSISHVRLTVTDIDRSRQFYEAVFGWPVPIEVPDADDATRRQLGFLSGGVIYDLGGVADRAAPGRQRPIRREPRRPRPPRVHSDHKAESASAAEHLDDLVSTTSRVKDIGLAYVLEFRDPDNIALELTAPK